MNLAGKDFFSLEPPIAPTVRYIHNVTFPVTIGGYSYMVGNQDAVSEQLEFDVFDDRNIHILAVGDLGKFKFCITLCSKNLLRQQRHLDGINLKLFQRIRKCCDL